MEGNNKNNNSTTATAVEAALKALQPIRNLALNWDIDIATCLDEYLEELVGDGGDFVLAGTHENNSNIMENLQLNFAQAALVLQSSSHVYSRKVEYLHSLVYKALDEFVAANQQNSKSNNKNSRSTPQEEFLEFDEQQDFLDLNDVLPLSTNGKNHNNQLPSAIAINDENSATPSRSGTRRRSSLTAHRLSMTLNNNGNKSNNNSLLFAASMLETSTTGGGRNSSGSHHYHGGPKQTRLTEGFGAGDSDYLHLPGSQQEQMPGGFFEDGPSSNSETDNDAPEADGSNDFAMAYDDGDDGGMPDDDDDGPGYSMNDNRAGWTDGGEQEQTNGNDTSQQRHVRFAASVVDSTKPSVDYWKRLDPHAPDDDKACRPLRVGQTIRLPPGVDAPPSLSSRNSNRATTLPRPQVDAELAKTNTLASSFATHAFRSLQRRQKRNLYDSDDDDSLSAEHQNLATVVPLQGLAFGNEFSYIAKANLKRKAAERRERRKLAQRQALLQNATEQHGNGYDDDNYYYDDGDDNDFPDDNDNDNGWGDGLGNTGMASVDHVYQNDDDGADVFGNNDDDVPPSFEELCRAHLRAFRKGAEKYASETQLIQRVDQWQDKLVPVLQAEEERPEFDIHEYGRNVLGRMETSINGSIVHKKAKSLSSTSKQSKVVDFQAVTGNRPQYEVCRLFLASLSLANAGNVHPKQELLSVGNHLELELLKSDLDLPMETYLAPSASSTTTETAIADAEQVAVA